MTRERVIVDFGDARDAKKVEETVKTGYAETTIENILQWMAVEEDLADSYGELSGRAKEPSSKATFLRLQEESKENVAKLRVLMKSFEALDVARVKRIELLGKVRT